MRIERLSPTQVEAVDWAIGAIAAYNESPPYQRDYEPEIPEPVLHESDKSLEIEPAAVDEMIEQLDRYDSLIESEADDWSPQKRAGVSRSVLALVDRIRSAR